MAKRNMKESMDNITNIKDSTAALSPEMQLAKEKAKDKDEEFEKIVLGKDVVLGASKQPTPDKPKWSLDESLFDKPISFEFDESLKESFYWLSDSRINILKRLGYSSKEDLAFAENLCEEEGLDLEEIVNTLDDIYKNGKEKAEAFYRDFFVDEDGNPIEIDESLGVSSSVELAARKDVTDYFQKMLYDQFLENPPQAQELDIEINSYDAEWSPQEFDSVSEKKFNKVKSLIDQLSIALSDMYFDDSLLESLKETLDNGKIDSREDDILDKVFAYLRQEKGDEEFVEFAKKTLGLTDSELKTFCGLCEGYMKEVLDESLSDREDIQNEIHRYNLLAPRYDKQSIIDELINDGYSYEEAEYIANHTTNLDESLRKDKNMKRYIIEEMNDEITDVDAYNESRDAKLVKRYKSILGLDEDFEITEENLDDWALKHACSLEGANYDRAKAAVLGLKFEGYK